jgi:putative ABC transport system permease protein
MFMLLCKRIFGILFKDRVYTGLNVAGLALAAASCLILGLYLVDELSYDRHYPNHARIFRIADAYFDYDTGNQRRELALSSPVLGPILAREFPEEVQAFVRLRQSDGAVALRRGDATLYWERAYYADANLFEVFQQPILFGDARTALTNPDAIALSASAAQRYFGDADPIGETLLMDGEPYRVTLVFADQPANTHLKYDVLFSFNRAELAVPENEVPRFLFGVSVYTYLLMPEGFAADDFAPIAATFYQRHMEALSRERTNRAWSGWLQPLASIHLGQELLNDQPRGNRYYLYGFASVVAFILLSSAINYVNLSIAGFSRRSREVGIRKILGEGRTTLVLQFLGEALLLVLASLLLGVLVVELSLNGGSLTTLFDKVLALDFTRQPALVWPLLGAALLFAVLAGLYPAFYLASFRPKAALAGQRTSSESQSALPLRQVLLLIQFTIAIGVIAATLVMAQQLRFIARQPLGFAKDNRVLFTLRDPALFAQLDTIEEELSRLPGVRGVSYANAMMGRELPVNSTSIDTEDGGTAPVQLSHMAVADNFLRVMGMQVVVGRDFAPEISTDAQSAILVNQALVDYMGWRKPLGKTLRSTWGTTGTVVGVVADFNFRSLHSPVEPLMLYQSGFSTPGRLGAERQLVVNLEGGDLAATLAAVRSKLRAFAPAEPMDYVFLDDSLDAQYLSEWRLITLVGLFAGICVVVTCLGLFGLAAFAAQTRTREMSIRRVLGAERGQILILLFKQTGGLLLCGAALATLIVYPLMSAWLSSFAYRVALDPLAFLVAALAVALVAGGVIGARSLRLATQRPALVLRQP